MLLVDPDAALITDNGPLLVRDAAEGARVWALSAGVRSYATIAHVEDHVTVECSAWVFSTCGDLVIGESTCIVTSDGLRSGKHFLAMKGRAYGYMSGSWPRLELFRPNREAASNAVRCTSLTELVSSNSVPGRTTIRVGTHSPERIKTFAAKLHSAAVTVEHGQSGWSWIQVPDTKPAREGSFDSDDVLLCWRRGKEDADHVLPISERRLRHWTTAFLTRERVAFETDYKPLYSPSEASITLKQNRGGFGEVRGVLRMPGASLSRVSVAERGVYVVVGGLLCSG